jgi:Arc/MetJ family transcription regulator
MDSLPLERVWGEFEKVGRKGVDFQSVATVIEQTGLQGKYGTIKGASPDLSGLSGDHRAAVALTAIGADPRKIGATKVVTQHMQELQRAIEFSGTAAESRAFARTMKLATFADAARVKPSIYFDPAVSQGPVKQLVSGKDLVAQGFKPGPEMGRILKNVTAAQDRGEVTTQSQALEWVKMNSDA